MKGSSERTAENLKNFTRAPLGMRHDLPVPNGTTVPHPQGKKFPARRWAAIRHGPTVLNPAGKKNANSIHRSGPSILRSNPGPDWGPNSVIFRTEEDRSSPVWAGLVSNRKLHTPNNYSYQATIKMAAFEALYDRTCRTPMHWIELDKTLILGPEMIQEMVKNIKIV